MTQDTFATGAATDEIQGSVRGMEGEAADAGEGGETARAVTDSDPRGTGTLDRASMHEARGGGRIPGRPGIASTLRGTATRFRPASCPVG